MLRKINICFGPIRDKWTKLINSSKIISDPIQIRAVGIVDDFYLNVQDHKVTSNEAVLDEYDLSVFAKISEYTKKIAEERRGVIREHVSSTSLPDITTNSPSPSISPECVPISAITLSNSSADPIKSGIYLFGSVGRGKTVLMDIYYNVNISSSKKTTRFHFFQLMKIIHNNISLGITSIGNNLANQFNVICIDEVAITDIQDATLFPPLLEILLKRNVVIMMTSNQHPQSLYLGGLNRHVYLPPLLRELKNRVIVVSLNGDVDYRTLGGGKTRRDWKYLVSQGEVNNGVDGTIPFFVQLSPTRTMSCGYLVGNEVHVDIDNLITIEFSESDYLALSSTLNNQHLTLVPYITTVFTSIDILERARRFTKFVETIYDQNCSVQFRSTVTVDDLFRNVSVDDLGNVVGDTVDSLASSLANGAVNEGIRSIDRCVSRLKEGQKHGSYKPVCS